MVVHQPIAVTRDDDLPNRLHGHEAARQRWAAAGANLIMVGHIRRPYVMALKHLARPMWAVQAGTAVSTRVRPGAPNSVNLLRGGQGPAPGHCQIEQGDFTEDAGTFVCSALSEVWPAGVGNQG